jgi:hypothetical protein
MVVNYVPFLLDEMQSKSLNIFPVSPDFRGEAGVAASIASLADVKGQRP